MCNTLIDSPRLNTEILKIIIVLYLSVSLSTFTNLVSSTLLFLKKWASEHCCIFPPLQLIMCRFTLYCIVVLWTAMCICHRSEFNINSCFGDARVPWHFDSIYPSSRTRYWYLFVWHFYCTYILISSERSYLIVNVLSHRLAYLLFIRSCTWMFLYRIT